MTIETIFGRSEEVVKLQPSQLQTMYVHYKPDTRRYMTNMVKNVALPDFMTVIKFFKAKEKIIRFHKL